MCDCVKMNVLLKMFAKFVFLIAWCLCETNSLP